MNFAFKMAETVIKYPAEFFTIMECLRLGGHRVVILTAQESVPANLGFDFSHFETAHMSSADEFKYCQENQICAFFRDRTFNIFP